LWERNDKKVAVRAGFDVSKNPKAFADDVLFGCSQIVERAIIDDSVPNDIPTVAGEVKVQ